MEYEPNINLTEIFQKFAAKAVEDFPHLKEKLVVFSAPTQDFFGEVTTQGAESSLDDKRGLQQAIKNNVEGGNPSVNEPMFKSGITKAYAFPLHMFTAGEKVSFDVIALGKIGIDNRVMTSSAEPFQREIRNMLEHELGHIVAQGGRDLLDKGAAAHHHPESHQHESVADTFALLRQIQRNESIDRTVEASAWSRSMRLVLFNEADHLTTPALLAAHELSRTTDLTKLSPQETANLASKIVKENTPSAAEMAQIRKIYEPVLETYKAQGLMKALDRSSEIMLADHGPNTKMVYSIGKSFMQPLLDNRLDILNNSIDIDDLRSGQIKLQGKQWDSVRQDVQKRDTEYHPVKTAKPLEPATPAASKFVSKEAIPVSASQAPKYQQKAGKATGVTDIAVSLAEGRYGAAAVSAGQQALMSQETYKAAETLTKNIAPIAKGLGQFAKRLPLIGAAVTLGYVGYEVVGNLLDGKPGKAGAAAAAGAAEIGGNFVGFGAGDAAREAVRGGIIAAAGENYAADKSGLRVLAERGIDVSSKFINGDKKTPAVSDQIAQAEKPQNKTPPKNKNPSLS